MTVAVPTYFGIVGTLYAQDLRVSRPACAAAAQRAGIGERHHGRLNAIAFACMAALGRPCRRKLHAQSFGINKLSLGTSSNSKALPRRHIEAVLARRSQLGLSAENVAV